jgi:hypothetical protein
MSDQIIKHKSIRYFNDFPDYEIGDLVKCLYNDNDSDYLNKIGIILGDKFVNNHPSNTVKIYYVSINKVITLIHPMFLRTTIND